MNVGLTIVLAVMWCLSGIVGKRFFYLLDKAVHQRPSFNEWAICLGPCLVVAAMLCGIMVALEKEQHETL